MPIFDQGYQHWQGKLSGHAWSWLTITRRGVKAQMKGRWLRIIMLVSWLPSIALAFVLICWGLIEQKSEMIKPLLGFLRLPPEIVNAPETFRTTVWTLSYHYFFEVEIFLAMILIVLVGPNLISQDLRFNAIPLYFSRPLRRFDYFMGKLGVIAVFLGAVIIVPAVVAYLLGACFSLDLAVMRATGRIFLASLGYGLVVVLSAGLLMLALSSLSRNSRYVAAMWVGIWIVSSIVAQVVSQLGAAEHARREAEMMEFRSQRNRMRDSTALPPGASGMTQPGQQAGFGPGFPMPDGTARPRPGMNPLAQNPLLDQLLLGKLLVLTVDYYLATLSKMPADTKAVAAAPEQPEEDALERFREARRKDWSALLSYTANLKRVGNALLGTDAAWSNVGQLMNPRRRDLTLAQQMGPQHPWYWSAGILAGLGGLSICILNLRVKSLDRLK
jgi:ABC-2 type transport system permease protein